LCVIQAKPSTPLSRAVAPAEAVSYQLATRVLLSSSSEERMKVRSRTNPQSALVF
jgi:hypothetical protein